MYGPENQDRGVILHALQGLVLAVADGAGGQSGAVRAAELPVDLASKAAEGLKDSARCAALLTDLDRAICRDAEAGETTCALAVVSNTQIFGASVGDSGVWVITSNEYTDLSRRQSRKPFLGSGFAVSISFSRQILPGELVLLATDGLLKYAAASHIYRVCQGRDPEVVVEDLLSLVRFPSGAFPDDVTIILCKVSG